MKQQRSKKLVAALLVVFLISAFFMQISKGQEEESIGEEREEQNWDQKFGQHSSALREMEQLMKLLSKEYQCNVLIKGKRDLPITQLVDIKNCQLDIRTMGENGLIYYDRFNLIKQRPYRKTLSFKGMSVIAFGTKAQLKGRPGLYFEDRVERRSVYRSFSRLHYLCRKLRPNHNVPLYTEVGPGNAVDNPRQDNTAVAVAAAAATVAVSAPYVEKQNQYTGPIPWGEENRGGSIHVDPKENNQAAVLIEPYSFLLRYKSAINAKKSIFAEYLIFRGDESGKIIGDLMIKRRGEGLDVKVMVDGLSKFNTSQGKTVYKNTLILYNNLMAAGIRVFGYSCGRRYVINDFKKIDLLKLTRRSHEKLWVVDGEAPELDSSVLVMGGMNMSQEYFRFREAGENRWRDQDVALKGQVIQDAYNSFMRSFHAKSIEYKTYKEDTKCFNPYDPIAERINYLRYKNQHTQEYLPLSAKENEEAKTVLANIEQVKAESNTDPKYFATNAVRYIHTRPDEREHYAVDTYIELIDRAQHELIISNAYFIAYPRLKSALIAAAERGVKITILSNTPETNDLPMMSVVGRRHYYDLVTVPKVKSDDFKIKIYEWVGKHPGDKEDATEGTIHNKYMVVDHNVTIIGSFNLDGSSLKNSETVVVYESPELATELLNLFAKDLEMCVAPSLEDMYYFKYPKGRYRWPYRLQLRFGKVIESSL
ncbi:MAG: phosphatidylserine/phosphatidylglycerophosphate/cardiolipin synthase family protein [Oligoflexia bacterium]|nr:phosphatidylserine/phosphatidylglycerophosphate/cardiolipin synthase family protein [Oligoflexia bacterium]